MKIPRNWENIRFGELNQHTSRMIDPSVFPDELFELYSVPTFPTGKPEIQKGSAIGSTKQVVEPGDVLVCKINPRINRVWQVGPKKSLRQIASSEWIVMRAPQMDVRFLRDFFRSNNFRDFICQDVTGVGGSLTRAQPKRVATFHLPIAPLNEQKRIADKLDALLARVDVCREHLDRVPAILKRFRQAVLAMATSGKLTGDWREKNTAQIDASWLAGQIHEAHEAAGGHKVGNAAPPTDDVHNLNADMFPQQWALLTLRDIVSPDKPITYGILKPGPELEEGVPYIRVADFPNDKLNLETIRKTSFQMDENFKRSRLKGGDLLLSIRGTVGRLVVIPEELEGANITQDSARLSIQPGVNRDYVLWFLRSERAQSRMRGAVKGVAVRGINIGDVRALQVPLPSRKEQDEIVRRIEALFAYADRLETRYVKATDYVEHLTPALLEKAFRGELVPQNPDDEPVGRLLERIQNNSEKIRDKRESRKAVGRPKKTKKAEVIMLNRKNIKDSHLSSILQDRGPLTAEALWSASKLEIDDFYDQLKDEEERGLLKESRPSEPDGPRLLESAA